MLQKGRQKTTSCSILQSEESVDDWRDPPDLMTHINRQLRAKGRSVLLLKTLHRSIQI